MDEILIDLYNNLKIATYWDYAALLAITLLAAFIYYKIRFQFEVQKYQLENKEKEFSIWKTYLEYSEKFESSQKEFYNLILKYGNSKTKKSEDKSAEYLSDYFYFEVFPALRNLLECAKIKNQYNQKENKLFIEEGIIPFLETVKMYFTLVGDKGLDHSTLLPIYLFGKENLRIFDLQLKKKLQSCLKDIENGEKQEK
jgi:hypothetical protein